MKIVLALLIFFTFQAKSFSSNKWETMKLTYDYHFKGEGGLEKLLSPDGERVITQVQDYISNPQNDIYLNTSDGQKLLIQHQKYLNFLSAKKTLDECQNDKNSKRKLESSILSGILNQEVDEPTCRKELLETYNSIFKLNNEVITVTNSITRGAFLEELNFRSTLNTFDSYLTQRYRYDPNFLSDQTLSQDKEESLRKFCEGDKYCSQSEREKLSQIFNVKSQDLQNNQMKVTPQQAADNINTKIDKLNHKLDEIKIKRDKGILSDHIENGLHFVMPYLIDTADPDLADQETQTGFQNYVKEYINTTSEGDGILMHTESIRDEMGNLKTIDSDDDIDEDTHLTGSTYKFEHHDKISVSDAEDAIDDVFDGIDGQIEKLKKIYLGSKNLKKMEKQIENSGYSKTKSISSRLKRMRRTIKKHTDKNINFLVKSNPKSVSQILVNNPGYAPIVCDELIKIDKDDEDSKGNGDLFIYGGIALGVLGFFTGGLTWLLGGALAAGTVATIGTVTTGLLIASTATTAIGSGISFTESRILYNQAKEVENGILSGNGYTETSEFMRDSYLAYKDALYDTTLNAALSITGMGALGSLTKLGKNSAKLIMDSSGNSKELKITKEVIDKLTSFYKKIGHSKTASKLLENTIKMLGPKGQEQFDQFMAQVAYLPEASRQKLLAAILVMSPNTSKLAILIKKAQCK